MWVWPSKMCSLASGQPGAVYSSYLRHTNQRPRLVLHYIQAAKRFEVVTRQAGSNMLLGSMSTGDIMAAKAFVFGMSWTTWATATDYQQYINAGGTPAADLSKGVAVYILTM